MVKFGKTNLLANNSFAFKSYSKRCLLHYYYSRLVEDRFWKDKFSSPFRISSLTNITPGSF